MIFFVYYLLTFDHKRYHRIIYSKIATTNCKSDRVFVRLRALRRSKNYVDTKNN